MNRPIAGRRHPAKQKARLNHAGLFFTTST
jgi:hypothetical protein